MSSGPFWWVHVANQMGFKPWLGLFLSNVAETNTADLRGLVTNGNATTSVHSLDCCTTFFYFNHDVGALAGQRDVQQLLHGDAMAHQPRHPDFQVCGRPLLGDRAERLRRTSGLGGGVCCH